MKIIIGILLAAAIGAVLGAVLLGADEEQVSRIITDEEAKEMGLHVETDLDEETSSPASLRRRLAPKWGLNCNPVGSDKLDCHFNFHAGTKFQIKWRESGVWPYGWQKYDFTTDQDGVNHFWVINLNCETDYNVRVRRKWYSYSTETFKTGQCPCVGPPCPLGGHYDGANCQIGVPGGNAKAFIHNNNYYYTGPDYDITTTFQGVTTTSKVCAYPGSHWDGANCFVMAVPSGAAPFIWKNHWYYGRMC